MEDKFTKRVDVQIFTGIISLGLILVLLKSFIVKEHKDIPIKTDLDFLIFLVNDLNKYCPYMVDGETRIDNMTALPPNTIQFNYTLVNWVKDSLNIDELYKGLEPGVLNGCKTSPDLKVFRDEKVTMNYYIRDKEGVFLFRIVVTPDDYLSTGSDEPTLKDGDPAKKQATVTYQDLFGPEAPSKDVEAPLMKGVREINKICPQMVDKGTRIDNAQLVSENTIQINYTMLNWTKDALDIEMSKKLNQPNAISTVKKSSMIKFYRDNKVTVVYHYSDKNGVFLFETVVTPEMYSN
jgi:hypothetical protein